jgi:sigma-E factor negative regulatory protein RseC
VFPILLLIVGAAIGQEIAPKFDFNPSGFSAIMGFTFFVVALLIIKTTANKLAKKNDYRPKIIKILNGKVIPRSGLNQTGIQKNT